MPEQVRFSVENDYRNGDLKLLLSSNTIGQGLNFPIKNLLFYSIQIGQNNYIDCRDFWNIVGRAGRAGKETEGQIIFIIGSSTDARLFNKYIDKNNIEDADSLFFKIVDILENRFGYSEESFFSDLSILSESYLLDLLSEEIIGTEYEEIIEEIIENSLFKVQIDNGGLDIEPLKTGFKRIFKYFEEDSSIEQLSKYKITGFSFSSNRILENFIKNNIENLREFVAIDDYLGIIQQFLTLIAENEIHELKEDKLDALGFMPTEYYEIIESWINGISIIELIEIWNESKDEDVKSLHIFISKALYYLYPWGVTSFLIILSYQLGIDFKELPENIKNLSSFIKFGVNNPASCIARALGVKSRQVSLFLNDYSENLNGHEFIKWVSNLTIEEIDSFDISVFEKDNLKDVSLKLTPTSYRNAVTEFVFRIRGTFYNTQWSLTSLDIELGETLEYKRDEENPSDPYAIFIMKNDKILGYIPREASKFISSEIDIEDSKFLVIVEKIIKKDNHNEIYVHMNKVFR